METDKDLLGLCIPTFNRKELLGECIVAAIREFSEYDFPIYVSDNASNDGTKELVLELREKYPRVVYSRNATNMGLYSNVLKAIKMARTRFIWLMGDDDHIKPNGVYTVIRNFKKDYDFLVLNSSARKPNNERRDPERIIKCKWDATFSDPIQERLLYSLRKNAYYGFISSMVIKTSIIQDLVSKYENPSFPLYNNIWGPTALFYESITGKTGLFVCEPLVSYSGTMRALGKSAVDYLINDRVSMLEYLERYGFETGILRSCLNSSLTETLWIAVTSKALSSDEKLYSYVIRNNKIVSFRIKCTFALLDASPLYVSNAIYRIIRRVRK